jgi:hypothetical protein
MLTPFTFPVQLVQWNVECLCNVAYRFETGVFVVSILNPVDCRYGVSALPSQLRLRKVLISSGLTNFVF